jgi:hypothetical protein
VAAQAPESAAALIPACRLYLQSADKGQRLRLERGVCIGTAETVLRLHRELRAANRFCPPQQVTLRTAIEAVVAFARPRQDLGQPLHVLAIEAFKERWPCKADDDL